MFNEDLKTAWGFHPMQDAFYLSLKEGQPNLVPARVTFSSHDQYRILILGMEEEKGARVRGHFYFENLELPVVGDWVAIELEEGDHAHLPIFEVLPRISQLRRAGEGGQETLVANVDHIGLVTSFNEDFNLRRLERGLAMISEGGAIPFIVINKADLVEKEEMDRMLLSVSERFPGVSVFPCSAQSGWGVVELRSHFSRGESVTFLGMSGVGKSSLINTLLGVEDLKTSEIRSSDGRGRHTTTHRELLLVPLGFWVMDTPGIRAFSYGGDEESLREWFEDVNEIMNSCRFTDCQHKTEPGCAITKALESGALGKDRWNNYLKMKAEAAFQSNKNNKTYKSEKKKEYAKRSSQLRQRLKQKAQK